MFGFIEKWAGWKITLLITTISILSFLAFGQAITVAWLSNFPEQAARLDILEVKFWSYIVFGSLLFVFNIIVVFRYILFKCR